MRAPARHDCPICGRPVTPGDPSRPPPFPFCSPACKLVDLGRWLDGSYRLVGPPEEFALELDREAGDRE